jgi:hypothetical protein
MNAIHHCDFCGDGVQSDDSSAMIYGSRDFGAGAPLSLGFKGAWLACTTCAAFIRQYDDETDPKAKHNLAMRSMEKYRRKYGLRGISDREVNKILMQEINKLHEAFWAYRTDTSPVPYAIKQLEG